MPSLRVILATKVFILTTVISINGTGETDLCTHHHVYHVLCATLAKTPFQMCSIVCSFTAFANLFPSVVCVRVFVCTHLHEHVLGFPFSDLFISLSHEMPFRFWARIALYCCSVSRFFFACYAHLPFLYNKILNFSSSRHLVFVRKRHSFSLFASEHQSIKHHAVGHFYSPSEIHTIRFGSSNFISIFDRIHFTISACFESFVHSSVHASIINIIIVVIVVSLQFDSHL